MQNGKPNPTAAARAFGKQTTRPDAVISWVEHLTSTLADEARSTEQSVAHAFAELLDGSKSQTYKDTDLQSVIDLLAETEAPATRGLAGGEAGGEARDL